MVNARFTESTRVYTRFTERAFSDTEFYRRYLINVWVDFDRCNYGLLRYLVLNNVPLYLLISNFLDPNERRLIVLGILKYGEDNMILRGIVKEI